MPRNPSPVIVRGKTYASMTEAADDLGISLAWLYRLRQQGRLEQAGLLPPNPNNQAQSLPITIRGVAYPSYHAAADALGVSISAISHAVRRGEENGDLNQRLAQIGSRAVLR